MSQRTPSRIVIAAAVALLAAALAGCKDEPEQESWDPPTTPIYAETRAEKQLRKEPFKYEPGARYEAVVTTSMGAFRLAFYPDEVPKTVERFVVLAAGGFHDGLVVHRVVPDVVILTGDADGSGMTEQGSPISAMEGEFSQRQFVRGTVGLARRPDNPDSATSMWFVCLARMKESDGQRAAFAHVTEGLDVVDRISRVEVEGERAIHPSRRERPVEPPVIEKIEVIKVADAPDAGPRTAGGDEPATVPDGP